MRRSLIFFQDAALTSHLHIWTVSLKILARRMLYVDVCISLLVLLTSSLVGCLSLRYSTPPIPSPNTGGIPWKSHALTWAVCAVEKDCLPVCPADSLLCLKSIHALKLKFQHWEKPTTTQNAWEFSYFPLYFLLRTPAAQFLLKSLGIQTFTKSKYPEVCVTNWSGLEGWEAGHATAVSPTYVQIFSPSPSFSLCLFPVSRTPVLWWQGANLLPSVVVSFSRVRRKAPVERLLCLLLAASPHWEAVLIVWASVLSPTH